MNDVQIVAAYKLSSIAVVKLQVAKTADIADCVFNLFAPHVEKRDRAEVWFAVDDVR